MNFGPSYSQFKCCPGHPYSYPQYYFTPLICEWQQPDYRPIHFGNETRFTSKTGKNCIPPGQYEYITQVAVMAYEAENKRMSEQLEQVVNDLSIDRIYLIMTNQNSVNDFITRYKKNFQVRSKVVRPYIRPKNDKQGLAAFAQRFLQGEITTLFP